MKRLVTQLLMIANDLELMKMVNFGDIVISININILYNQSAGRIDQQELTG